MTSTERALRSAGLAYEVTDTLDDLGECRRGIDHATDELTRLRTRRDALIVHAVTLGAPREDIAEAAGVSRQQVHSIATRNVAD